ncbi:MAG: hypothetical protein C4K58_04075 [Flavobacteriaceae bacterium]|nr:MAG: hypothetical protein C4K58_04075 [Flavobacteriaceae bacterium]
MKKILLFLLLASVGCTSTKPSAQSNTSVASNGQDGNTNFVVNGSNIQIPGKWQALNFEKSSGQQYFINEDRVILAIAKNPKVGYEFFDPKKSDFENVYAFYKWDSDYMIQKGLATNFILEDKESKFVIWKYNDKKSDNVFLFGNSKNHFVNLLIYTNLWDENQKVEFLKNLYFLNNK